MRPTVAKVLFTASLAAGCAQFRDASEPPANANLDDIPLCSSADHPGCYIFIDGLPRVAFNRYEVTVEQWDACVTEGGCRSTEVQAGGGYFNLGQPNREQHPINGLTWSGANAVCLWMEARLPTGAEWEVAFKGHDIQCPRRPSNRVVNGKRMPGDHCEHEGTASVMELPQFGPHGLVGMAGNVWEWTSDTNDEGQRGQIGGGWTWEQPQDLQFAPPAMVSPTLKLPDIGARCVR